MTTIIDELSMKMGERLKMLAESRVLHVKYLDMKIAEEDWHGVSDAANDLREIDAEARVISHFRETRR